MVRCCATCGLGCTNSVGGLVMVGVNNRAVPIWACGEPRKKSMRIAWLAHDTIYQSMKW
jgi:hypothetical protein